MKRLILAGLVTLSAFGAVQVSAPKVEAQAVDCTVVRCAACPPGFELAPTGNDCCRCKKI
ncbi:MAG TPA: hypothetical protein VMW27_28750 [Thermoanaerobaculia bacterium]|nr:hypothetical protein [Thermoanaerobaculia bacterium]